jgi:hypothetical protein
MLVQEKKISATAKTPEIILNPEGIIMIKGRWMMENIADFSKALSDWFDTYVLNLPEVTAIDIHLEYFSGFNSAILISLLRKISGISMMHKELIINWYYEEGDQDILELGEYISSVLDTPFNFIMISDYKHRIKYLKVQV